MRPLYLVFENLDELGDLVRIIFKNGDGECTLTLHLKFFRVKSKKVSLVILINYAPHVMVKRLSYFLTHHDV